jgi:hypothetical protein
MGSLLGALRGPGSAWGADPKPGLGPDKALLGTPCPWGGSLPILGPTEKAHLFT